MIKKSTRILTLVLAVALALCALNLTAFASTEKLTTGVTKSKAKVYEIDDLSEKAITTIPKGKTITFLWEAGDWYYVAYGNYCGYIQAKCARPNGDVEDNLTYGQITKATRIYKKTSTKKGSVSKISKGSWVMIIGETSSYYRVAYDSKVGYVLKKYVEPEYSALGVADVANCVYCSEDNKYSLEVGMYSDGSGYYAQLSRISDGSQIWYGVLDNTEDVGDTGLRLTFKQASDSSVICVEWATSEGADFPEVIRGGNTGSLPGGVFTDYSFEYNTLYFAG